MRNTFSSWRFMSTSPMYTMHSIPSRAAAVAVATPCWPAPVSATNRVLPIRCASRACPSTLLILCEPVWFRSSRFITRVKPNSSENRGQSVIGFGRPVYSRCRRSSSPRNSGSAHASANACSSSMHAGTNVSGTKRPPNSPKRPVGPGSVIVIGCHLSIGLKCLRS